MPGKNILVIWFSQSGQLKQILDSVLGPLQQPENVIDWIELKPDPAFPFPWPSDQFFDVFPETFMGIPCKLHPLQTKGDVDYDLVVLGYSPWFLSPSLPVTSFLQSPVAKELLKDKKVITVIGCRNMWLMSQEKMKRHLHAIGALLTGNIVLRDRAANLTSLITIIRWLINGRQAATRLFPRAGVSLKDIDGAQAFGHCIREALNSGNYGRLQQQLNDNGALKVAPNLLFFERNGSKIFKMWASEILKKGPHGDPRRRAAHRMFKWYLLTVLFVASPVGNLIYSLILPFKKTKVKKEVEYFSGNSLSNSD